MSMFVPLVVTIKVVTFTTVTIESVNLYVHFYGFHLYFSLLAMIHSGRILAILVYSIMHIVSYTVHVGSMCSAPPAEWM